MLIIANINKKTFSILKAYNKMKKKPRKMIKHYNKIKKSHWEMSKKYDFFTIFLQTKIFTIF